MSRGQYFRGRPHSQTEAEESSGYWGASSLRLSEDMRLLQWERKPLLGAFGFSGSRKCEEGGRREEEESVWKSPSTIGVMLPCGEKDISETF